MMVALRALFASGVARDQVDPLVALRNE